MTLVSIGELKRPPIFLLVFLHILCTFHILLPRPHLITIASPASDPCSCTTRFLILQILDTFHTHHHHSITMTPQADAPCKRPTLQMG
ncbi:hypothetical protein C6558_37725 [Ensifer sp. NM-2]|nr:hypothetical protein C6558_37725 [Ensifer sp. NM-2]